MVLIPVQCLIPLKKISLPNLFLFSIWSDNKRINSSFFSCNFNFSATSRALNSSSSDSGRGVDIKLGGKSKEEQESDKQEIKSLGGLFVIGTERMESRRVDNQARGRSGRQGDEGNSIFYVSLEDDLMRIFGSESMNNILEKLGLKGLFK